MPAKIAICLFEESFVSFDPSELMGGQVPKPKQLREPDADVALFIKESNDTTPDWVDIVDTFCNLDRASVRTASSGAILFLKIKGRIMACCFGTSVANINRENIVRDFGLAVAFHRIPRTDYKGMETFTLTENPITSNKSAAMPSSQNSFNLDSYLETITELSGRISLVSGKALVKGKEFFSAPAPFNLAEIKKFCMSIFSEYEKTINDPAFKSLTAFTKVKEKKLGDFLNEKLLEALKKKLDNVHLVDYQQYETLAGYSLTPKGKILADLEIGDFYDTLKDAKKLSVVGLKTRRISVYNTDSQQIDEWPTYRCLFTEVSTAAGTHVLYKGNWYEIHKRYLKDLKEFVAGHQIDASTLKLPVWDGRCSEGDYNVDAAKAISGQCWDKVFYKHDNYRYKIEFCDILLPGHVMHVKKLSSSALNSHLLMQTYVSAQLLSADAGIRKWICSQSRKTFRSNIFLSPRHKFKSPPVKYLIVLMSKTAKTKVADALPFFSLITFNMVIRKISQLNFEVEVCLV